MDLTDDGPAGSKKKRSMVQDEFRKKNLTSSSARPDRGRANSLDLGSSAYVEKSDGFVIKARKKPSTKKVGAMNPVKLDHLDLVLFVDRVGLDYSNRCKPKISLEVQRIAPGVILTGIFFLPRGGIKLIVGDVEMKQRILESRLWGVDAFGTEAAICHPPRVAGWSPPNRSNVVWMEESKCFVDSCKVVLDQVPAEYPDQSVLEKLTHLGVTEVKTMKLPQGRHGDPQRLLTFVDGDRARSALESRFAFALNGCAFRGRYLRVMKPPVQCNRCLKFGHAHTVCMEQVGRCRMCGVSGHMEGDSLCQAVVNDEDIKCANCGGNHPATSYICPVFKETKAKLANNVRSVAKRSGISYSQAASKAGPPITSDTEDGKTSKLLCSFISILVATRKERDSAKLVSICVNVLRAIAPEFLEDSMVRESLGLGGTKDASTRDILVVDVGNTAQQC